jgi:tRNA pseudouridine55 synthase
VPRPSPRSAKDAAEAPEAGFLLLDKPAGISSHTAIAEVRRRLGGVRTGHAGTLDPFATGLLVVLLGRATRLQRYVLGLEKTYVATARLGWTSSTGDPEGELTETGRIPERLELPTGRIRQRVPMTSAVKVGGERLYRKARRGEDDPDRPVREVEVHRAELLDSDPDTGTARFEIVCSAGTYVRTLVEELGDAYCCELRRTAVGELRVEEAGETIHRPEELVVHLPARELGAEEAREASHGIPLDAAPGDPEGPIRLLSEGRLIAVARVRDGRLRADVVLA